MAIDKLRKNPFLTWVGKHFTTGLLVFMPVVLTVYLLWFICIRLDGIISKHVRHILLQNYGESVINLWHIPYVGTIKFPPPGFGIAILILIIFMVGILARYILGLRFIRRVENSIKKVPLISLIYFGIKQISYVFIREKGAIFHQAVLLEYPRKGVYSVGFITVSPKEDLEKVLGITGDVPLVFAENQKEESLEQEGVRSDADQKLCSVFLPTTPNIMSGHLIYLPAGQLIPLNIDIEDAMKLIISAGTVLPSEILPEEFT